MAVTTNLYPPIVNDIQPAFVKTNTCKIYFSLSSFNSLDEIKHVQITVVNQNTNQSILNPSMFPLGIKFVTDISQVTNPTDDYKYYVTIYYPQLVDREFKINQFYKVQLRFYGGDDPTPPNPTADWVEEHINDFSEWSKVCLIKPIEQPLISINTLDSEGITTFFIPPTEFVGKLYYQQNEDVEKETLKSFNINIYQTSNQKTVVKSNEIYTNSFNPNEFYYQLLYDLQKQVNYTLAFNYTTINLYKETVIFQFKIAQQAENLLDINVSIASEEDCGRIKIIFNAPSSVTNKNLIIKRTSSKTNFLKWESLKTIINSNSIQYLWYDTTIESGIWYKYRIQENAENAKISQISQPIICVFEDIFLTQGNKQLKVQFNPVVSDFRYNVTESQQVTLGSKYPYVKRNGNNYFRSFSLGGLISALMDEQGWYDPNYQDGYFYHKNKIEPFTTPQEIYDTAAPLYETYNINNNIDSYQDYIYEREFRQKVLDFLYQNNIKLFRSLTEGNILVKLINVSLQPVESLGRRLYSFSATAIEIDDMILEKLKQYNLINNNHYIYSTLTISDTFASGESLINKFYNTIEQSDPIDVLKLIINHSQSKQVVVYAKPINNKELFRYVTANKQLILYYSEEDPIAECYFYGIHLQDSDITFIDEYYSKTSDVPSPINGGVYFIAKSYVYKINRYISYYNDAGLLTTYYDETVKNSKNDYAILVEPYYERMIYYNNSWYPFLDNHDIILETLPATIEYTYRLKKED